MMHYGVVVLVVSLGQELHAQGQAFEPFSNLLRDPFTR